MRLMRQNDILTDQDQAEIIGILHRDGETAALARERQLIAYRKAMITRAKRRAQPAQLPLFSKKELHR